MWLDLTQRLGPGIPGSPSVPEPTLEPVKTHERDGVSVQRYGAVTHVGTHVDAPRHFVADGATIDEIPPGRFAGDALVLDLEREEAGEITARDLEAAEERADDEVREGDLLLLRTGWGAKFDDQTEYEAYPWLVGGVEEWLLERGIGLLGVDTISPDRPRALRPEGWDEYPIHYGLLENDVLIAEHLDLEAVAGERLEVFGFPIKLDGGDGAPARFVARR
ncbi:MAG: cyclase family protein [Haloarculaceae archaeon]